MVLLIQTIGFLKQKLCLQYKNIFEEQLSNGRRLKIKLLKLSLCLTNEVLRHKFVWGVDVQIHVFLTTALFGGGQLHAPATLLPGKDLTVPIG
jgi:hypothetical protein